jgi:hypothetical protein
VSRYRFTVTALMLSPQLEDAFIDNMSILPPFQLEN